jgi:hypothetical protein
LVTDRTDKYTKNLVSSVLWLKEDFSREANEYLKFPRLAFTLCGDRIKYDEKGEIERMFPPRYG